MKANKRNKALIVLGSATIINFVSGIIYIWSIFSKALIDNLNWTSKQASLPYTISTISFAIAMIIAGGVLDKKGPKVPSIIGSGLLGLGIILSGFTNSPMTMSLTMGIFAGAGIGIINVSTAAAVLKWFPPEKKGMATGIVAAGGAIASSLYSPIANHLINTKGISLTFILLGIPIFIVSIILSWLLDNPPLELELENRGENELSGLNDFTWKEMIKTSDFYKIWLILALSSSGGLMIIGHISTITKVQIGWEAGFIFVMILSIFNMLGRIVGGFISDKIERIILLRMIFILQGINMILFSTYNSILLLSIGAIVAGFAYGAGFAIFPSLVTEEYGIKNFGTNYAIIFTAWGIGGVIGPMTAASILDRTNSYNYSYLIAFILFIISIIITFTFKKEELEKIKG